MFHIKTKRGKKKSKMKVNERKKGIDEGIIVRVKKRKKKKQETKHKQVLYGLRLSSSCKKREQIALKLLCCT